MITFEQLTNASQKALDDVNKLLAQLSSEENVISLAYLQRILKNENIGFFVAKDDEKIIGMGILALVPVVSGLGARIEDVVIDENYRGKGLGKQLMQKIIEEARKKNVEYVELTSRPSRVVANKLYPALGFRKRETNVYTLDL